MKCTLNIHGYKLLLTAEQLATIVDTINAVEYIGDEHVGKGLGDSGYDLAYRRVVRPFDSIERLQVTVIADDVVDTLRLATKMFDESKT
jgi:hypothetical protein